MSSNCCGNLNVSTVTIPLQEYLWNTERLRKLEADVKKYRDAAAVWQAEYNRAVEELGVTLLDKTDERSNDG